MQKVRIKTLAFISLASFFGVWSFNTQAQVSLTDHWRRYIPSWIQYLSPLAQGKKSAKEAEGVFDQFKNLPQFQQDNLFVQKMFGPQQHEIKLYGTAELMGINIQGVLTNFGGPLILNKVSVRGLQVNGDLIATQSNLKNIDVKGQATLENSSVKLKGQILGSLAARNTTFYQDITVQGCINILSKCKVLGSLIFSKDHHPQDLYLINGTNIQGNIVFPKGNQVYKIFKDQSSTIHGTVSNAEIEEI